MSYSPSGQLNKFNQPSLVQFKDLKFLIMDSPSDLNIEQYVKELVRHGTTDIVRACEPHYSTVLCAQAGISCHDCEFKDGDPPPIPIINKWLDLIEKRCGSFDGKTPKETNNPLSSSSNQNNMEGGLAQKEAAAALHSKATDASKGGIQRCIAVHCVAGLGRAPMLVAVALMEAGFDAEDAVDLIRKTRRGAINNKQFNFLVEYKPMRKGINGSCCVMQ